MSSARLKRIALQRLLAAGAAIASGTLAGQQAGAIEAQRREDRELGQLMQVLHADESAQDREQQRQLQGLNAMSGLMDSDALDDVSAQSLYQRILHGMEGLGARTPTPYGGMLQSPRIQRTARKHGISLPEPATPAPTRDPVTPRGVTSAQPAAAAPDPAAGWEQVGQAPQTATPAQTNSNPANGFLSKRSRMQLADLERRAAAQIQQATATGDQQLVADGNALLTRIQQRDLSPTQAAIALQQLVTRQGVSSEGKKLDETLEKARAGHDRYAQIFQIKPEFEEEHAQIGAQFDTIDTSTPEGREAAKAFLARRKAFLERTPYGKPNVVLGQEETRKANDEWRAGQAVDRLARAIETAKDNPERFLAAIAKHDTYVKTLPPEYGHSLYDGGTFDTTPGTRQVQVPREGTAVAGSERDFLTGDGDPVWDTVDVEESAADVRARLRKVAEPFLTSEKAKGENRAKARAEIFQFARANLARMTDPKQRAALIHLLNDALDEAGIESGLPADLALGLTPNEKLIEENRKALREITGKRLAMEQKRLGFQERALKVTEASFNLAERKFAFEKSQAGSKAKPADTKQFSQDMQRLRFLTGKYQKLLKDKYPSDPGEENYYRSTNKNYDAEKARELDPLQDQIEKLEQKLGIRLGEDGEPEALGSGQAAGGGRSYRRISVNVGGQPYSIDNPYPDGVVPWPGGKGKQHSSNFGVFDEAGLQAAMGAVKQGKPGMDAFRAALPDKNAAELYLWEARRKWQESQGGK